MFIFIFRCMKNKKALKFHTNNVYIHTLTQPRWWWSDSHRTSHKKQEEEEEEKRHFTGEERNISSPSLFSFLYHKTRDFMFIVRSICAYLSTVLFLYIYLYFLPTRLLLSSSTKNVFSLSCWTIEIHHTFLSSCDNAQNNKTWKKLRNLLTMIIKLSTVHHFMLPLLLLRLPFYLLLQSTTNYTAEYIHFLLLFVFILSLRLDISSLCLYGTENNFLMYNKILAVYLILFFVDILSG